MHVPLDDHVFDDSGLRRQHRLLSREGLWVSSQEDALSLTARLRLHNESPIAFLIHLGDELLEICWQIVRRREKVVLFREH